MKRLAALFVLVGLAACGGGGGGGAGPAQPSVINLPTPDVSSLQDLGVKGQWLMPVAKSQDRDHGSAVADYRDIEADYGSLADLDELLRQAHARGIGVMLDYVVNHSAATTR